MQALSERNAFVGSASDGQSASPQTGLNRIMSSISAVPNCVPIWEHRLAPLREQVFVSLHELESDTHLSGNRTILELLLNQSFEREIKVSVGFCGVLLMVGFRLFDRM
jgi:hypothetical protein